MSSAKAVTLHKYRDVGHASDPTDLLAEMGNDGWTLACVYTVTYLGHHSTDRFVFYKQIIDYRIGWNHD